MRSYKNIALCFIFSFLMLMPSLALAQGIARVIAVTGGVSLERSGQSHELALKEHIWVHDSIRTDASGKVQLLFNDNSVVTVGINSHFVMEEYADGGTKSFKSQVVIGFARFVTGAIVESNPEAFTVQTPQATVGIRGTTLAVLTMHDSTSVFTENSLKQQSVVVQDMTIAPGHMAIFGSNAKVLQKSTPMSPAQRQELIERSRIVMALKNVHIAENSQYSPQWHEFDDEDLKHSLSDARFNDLAQNGLNSSFVKDVHAVASGEFDVSNGNNDMEGNFSFEANLKSGALSNATFATTGGSGGNFSVAGGTGTAHANGFTLGGGTATYTPAAGGNAGAASWSVVGNEALELGDDVEGDLTIGTINGTFTGDIDGELRPK